MIVASERQYKAAYSSLGQERVQQGTKGFVQISKSRRFRNKSSTAQEALDLKDYEKFWFPRRDENWANIPMKKVYSRKERKNIYIALVTEILVHLAPKTYFNPWLVWVKLKEKEAAQLLEQQSGESSSGKPTGTLSKLEQLRMENIQQKIEDAQIAEITRIRNSKDSISTLIRQLSTQRAREILLIEILKKAIHERNNAEIFDILWAIENFELTKQDAPKPKKPSDIIPSVRDPSLVYDSYKNVENLIEEARKLRHKETDIIRFQLNDMSDRLPPLSPYIFDFKLDAWQIRALQFIDAGKSLVICAPTSSGKTVLSTYVALISKHKAVAVTSGSGTSADDKNLATVATKHHNHTKSDNTEAVIDNGNDDDEGIVDLLESDSDNDDDDEEEDEEEEENKDGISDVETSASTRRREGGANNEITEDMIKTDREKRLKFRKVNLDGAQRVLFVVPSEPLVWQVAAYFTKLLYEEGDVETKVAIVTSQMMYFPPKKFNVMPQIVVGTPMALESALTKCRGLVGRLETVGKAQGDLLPGGFDHFDWAIFDEVHAIDGAEGDALQRLIRSMNCKFLALSATVGNAEDLLGWLERVKGDQLVGVETLTVLPEEATFYGTGINAPITPSNAVSQSSSAGSNSKDTTADKKKKNKAATAAAVVYLNITIHRQSDKATYSVPNISSQTTILDLKLKLWRLLPVYEKESEPSQLCLEFNGNNLIENHVTLESIGITTDSTINLVTFNLMVTRTVDNQNIILKHVSPLCTLTSLRKRIVDIWPVLTAEALQVLKLNSTPLTTITTTTKAIAAGDTTIEITSCNSVYPKGSLLCITGKSSDGPGPETNSNNSLLPSPYVEVVTLSCEKKANDTMIHIFPINKSFSDGAVCSCYNFKDLTENLKTMEYYGFDASSKNNKSSSDSDINTPIPIVQVRSLVNLLTHQGRFINLQRFLWTNSKLVPMSPLAAVESIEHLKQGILDNSSLSFTSKDSYRLWQELEKLYPADAIHKLNPHNFFNTTTRITLQSTKDYEDLLKKGLRELSTTYPMETKELLYKFRIEDDKNRSVDLTEMCLHLRNDNMLPCLTFHLNAFEAIALFKQLLAGIEYRQKKDHPLYYKELVDEKERLRKNTEKQQKDLGGNEKEAEEKAKSGEMDLASQDFSVDLYEPHPKYRFSKGSVMTSDEFITLSDEMERFDGFPMRDSQAMQQGRGKNEAVLSHALMRGLRRGIALYIDEVSSPAYRRAVQRLASQGKLGVVISDDSLAFGVNMPFRTCVFAGEMEGRLTPLMAQQMSGRAGRRGLDTQGSLIYAGARASFIRDLMIGQVANITGEAFPPRYESLFLQGMLSPRHTGWARVGTLSGKSLDEYAHGRNITFLENSDIQTKNMLCEVIGTGTNENNISLNYGLHYSKKVMADLGLIALDSETGSWVPSEEWESLSMVWELRNNVRESITLGRLLPLLCEAIEKKTTDLLKLMQTGNRSAKAGPTSYEVARKDEKDKEAKYVPFFYSILLQLIDRHPHDPKISTLPPLHEHPLFNEDRQSERSLYLEWSKIFENDQNAIPEHLSYLKSPVPPGTPLDSTLFYCVLDKEFVYTLTEEKKQDIKARIWHVGTTLKTMLNTLWPNNDYCKIMASCIRTCFRHLYYLNTELIRGQINFDDISASSKEAKADKEIAESEAGFPISPTAMPWADTDAIDVTIPQGVNYCEAMQRVVIRLKEWKQMTSTQSPTPVQISEILSRTVSAFSILKPDKDLSLARLCGLEFKDNEVPLAIASASFSKNSSRHLIGLLLWMCLKLSPHLIAKFPVYLKALIEYEKQDLLEEKDIKDWASCTAEVLIGEGTLPAGHEITVEEINKVKSSPTMTAFLNWLDVADDDEEEEDDDEDED